MPVVSLAVCGRRAVVLVSTRRIGCGLAAAATDAAAAGPDLRVTLAGVCVRSGGPPTAGAGWVSYGPVTCLWCQSWALSAFSSR